LPLKFNPGIGVIVACDYTGFKVPEMIKRRPVIILTPPMARRPKLCTVVPLSTTEPETLMPYHVKIELPFTLPYPFTSSIMWVKADMINAVSFDRLNLFRAGKDNQTGKRKYLIKPLDKDSLKRIRKAVLYGLDMGYMVHYV